MTKIIVSEDCGNAPKKAQLRDFKIAFVKNEEEHVLQELTYDIRWELVGDRVIEGKEELAKVLKQLMAAETAELVIKNIITHGNTAAMDGTITLDNNTNLAFCDILRFSSNAKDAKIKEITSYVIKF